MIPLSDFKKKKPSENLQNLKKNLKRTHPSSHLTWCKSLQLHRAFLPNLMGTLSRLIDLFSELYQGAVFEPPKVWRCINWRLQYGLVIFSLPSKKRTKKFLKKNKKNQIIDFAISRQLVNKPFRL